VNPERFKCLLLQINADQMLVEELGPIIERWVTRDPDNPNALEVLAWLMRLRSMKQARGIYRERRIGGLGNDARVTDGTTEMDVPESVYGAWR
jgi:hypothetical protein